VDNTTRSGDPRTNSGERRKQAIILYSVVVDNRLPPPYGTKQGVFQLAFQKQGSKQLYHPLWKDVERCPKMRKDERR
jgi:hypothetical protein